MDGKQLEEKAKNEAKRIYKIWSEIPENNPKKLEDEMINALAGAYVQGWFDGKK